MDKQGLHDLVHRYYTAWARQDRDGVAACLADNLRFVSPQDRFESADDFLDACWRYCEGLSGLRFLREIYDGDQAFVMLEWANEGGGRFADAEYLRCADGKIEAILVLANDPSFSPI